MSKQTFDPFPARAAAYVALYPMLLQIAKDHGYSLAIHGSLHRDFDLVAIPWIEEASEPLDLIKAIKEATRTVVHHEEMDEHYPNCDPTTKAHGRLAYSLHVTNRGMYGGYLDISVMPKIQTAADLEATWWCRMCGKRGMTRAERDTHERVTHPGEPYRRDLDDLHPSQRI